MLTHKITLYLTLAGMILFLSSAAQETMMLKSPDGNLVLQFETGNDNQLQYSLQAFGEKVIHHSSLGLKSKDMLIPAKDWKYQFTTPLPVKSTWKPVWGKRTEVADHYNPMVIEITGQGQNFPNRLVIETRAYNDGVAFRYVVPGNSGKSIQVDKELSEFNFAGDYTAWFYHGEYPNIGPEKLTDSSEKRMPVMTIKADKNLYLAIHEANLVSG
ncbi:MAG: glycoside hydrolase family 97 protein, partial [Bacteroidia bacterium]|nr:glycoside hydrolase family 97 protein [Bacteroidia bacterium]